MGARSTAWRQLVLMRRASWLAVTAGVTITVLLPSWPGRTNYDTDTMLVDMRRGTISDAYAPILQWLWRPWRNMGMPLSWVLVMQVVIIVLAIGALLRSTGASRRRAQVATVVVCLTPVVVSALISNTRDTWYLAGLLATVAALLHPTLGRRRRLVLVAIGCVAVLLVRQNAVFAVPVLIAAALRDEWPRLRRSRRIAAVGAMATLGPLMVLAAAEGFERLVGIRQVGPETVTMITDLDEMSSRTGELLLPADIANRPIDVAYLDSTSPYRLHQLFYLDGAVDLRLTPSEQELVRGWWRASVWHHFDDWVATRNQLFARQLGWSGPTYEVYLPVEGTSYSIPEARFADASAAVTTYLSWFADDGQWWIGGWIHRPWLWLAAAWAVAWRRSRHALTLTAVASAHMAGLWLTAPSVQYRLAEATVVLCLVAVAAALIEPTSNGSLRATRWSLRAVGADAVGRQTVEVAAAHEVDSRVEVQSVVQETEADT